MDFLHVFCKSPNHRKNMWFISASVNASEDSDISPANLSLIISTIVFYVFSNQSTHVVKLLIVKLVYRGSCELVHI